MAKQIAGLAMMRFNELGDWYDELFQRGKYEVIDFVYWSLAPSLRSVD